MRRCCRVYPIVCDPCGQRVSSEMFAGGRLGLEVFDVDTRHWEGFSTTPKVPDPVTLGKNAHFLSNAKVKPQPGVRIKGIPLPLTSTVNALT